MHVPRAELSCFVVLVARRTDRSNPFVSVDCGALDNGAAKRALPGWAPAALETRVRESVEWWVASKREHEQLAVSAQSEPQGPGGTEAPVVAVGEREASDFRFEFETAT